MNGGIFIHILSIFHLQMYEWERLGTIYIWRQMILDHFLPTYLPFRGFTTRAYLVKSDGAWWPTYPKIWRHKWMLPNQNYALLFCLLGEQFFWEKCTLLKDRLIYFDQIHTTNHLIGKIPWVNKRYGPNVKSRIV